MNKNVLITGVSSGIGFGLAEEYLNRGWNVYGCSRRTPEDIANHEHFTFSTADFLDDSQFPNAINELLADVTQIDIAVLNAGILGEFGDLNGTPLDDIQTVMQVNVWANKTILDVLFNSGKPIHQIVTMSSGASVNGNRGWNGYGLSKATLNMLTKLYAAEQPGTHFCAFAPGLVDTAMQDYLCGLPEDDRYSSLEALRSRRNTPEMPTGNETASRFVDVFAKLPQLVQSGDYADVRKLPVE